MITLSDIVNLHIELSGKCNLLCPMCQQSVKGGIRSPETPKAEISLEKAKKIAAELKSENLVMENIMFCGVYGDPAINKEALEIVKTFRNLSRTIHFYSNGSLRSPSWWSNLGKVLNRPGDYAVFSIDGLENTNSLYRIGSNWNKILANVKAFIGSGGRARWDYLVFEHNEHQLEEAQQLAQELGFKSFRIRKTSRFGTANSYTVLTKTGATKLLTNEPLLAEDVAYTLKPPTKEEYINWELSNRFEIISRYGSFDSYVSNTEIICKFITWKQLYISADYELWPCCYLAAHRYNILDKKTNKQLQQWMNDKTLSLSNKTIKEILSSDFFKRLFKSWTNEDRLWACGRTCGKGFDPIHSQTRTINLTD